MAEIRENVIEWITGDDRITCTFTQQRYITKARRTVERYKNNGDDRSDLIENPDGSVFCHLPLDALKLAPKATHNMSEEAKAAATERIVAARQRKAAGV